jgi:hypothetical protein
MTKNVVLVTLQHGVADVSVIMPLTYTPNDCLDIESDLKSLVPLGLFDQTPSALKETIGTTTIKSSK